MSTVSQRSYRHQRAVELDRRLTDLVAAARRDPNADTPTGRRARSHLAEELSLIAAFLDPLTAGLTPEASGKGLGLPVPLLRRLRAGHIDGRPVQDALSETIDRIEGDSVLSKEDLDLLQLVADHSRQVATEAFDRLIRR
jgi:hypothetical protein